MDMLRPLALILLPALVLGGCSRQDAKLEQYAKALSSLTATAAAIGDAWLAGFVSGTYADTALERTLQLVEAERQTLGGASNLLIDPRGARLSRQAERVSRALALMVKSVRESDAGGVRREMSEAVSAGNGSR
jgi:hypothetical protein